MSIKYPVSVDTTGLTSRPSSYILIILGTAAIGITANSVINIENVILYATPTYPTSMYPFKCWRINLLLWVINHKLIDVRASGIPYLYNEEKILN